MLRTVICQCGLQIRVSDETAGRILRCVCGRSLLVPIHASRIPLPEDPAPDARPVAPAAAPTDRPADDGSGGPAIPEFPARPRPRPQPDSAALWLAGGGAIAVALVTLAIASSRTLRAWVVGTPPRGVTVVEAGAEEAPPADEGAGAAAPPEPNMAASGSSASEPVVPTAPAEPRVPQPSPLPPADPTALPGAVVLYSDAQPYLARMRSLKDLGGDRPIALQFQGPGGDPNIISNFRAAGTWRSNDDGRLTVDGSKQAALDLGEYGDLELYCEADAGQLGGWFVLLGWNGDQGALLYHIQLQRSSAWFAYEAEDGKFPVRRTELTDRRWTGRQTLRVSWVHGVLSAFLDGEPLGRAVPLKNAPEKGRLHLGTATTEYGPMPLRIHRLVVRRIADP